MSNQVICPLNSKSATSLTFQMNCSVNHSLKRTITFLNETTQEKWRIASFWLSLHFVHYKINESFIKCNELSIDFFLFKWKIVTCHVNDFFFQTLAFYFHCSSKSPLMSLAALSELLNEVKHTQSTLQVTFQFSAMETRLLLW